VQRFEISRDIVCIILVLHDGSTIDADLHDGALDRLLHMESRVCTAMNRVFTLIIRKLLFVTGRTWIFIDFFFTNMT